MVGSPSVGLIQVKGYGTSNHTGRVWVTARAPTMIPAPPSAFHVTGSRTGQRGWAFRVNWREEGKWLIGLAWPLATRQHADWSGCPKSSLPICRCRTGVSPGVCTQNGVRWSARLEPTSSLKLFALPVAPSFYLGLGLQAVDYPSPLDTMHLYHSS